MQYYDINIPANKQQIVEAQGTFIYYLSGSAGGADNTIKVTLGMGGTTVLLKPGQSIRLPVSAKPIDMWRVENYANAQTIIGQVLVGQGDFKDTNTTGTVQVVDGGKSRTLGGGAFLGYLTTAAVAGQYTINQLWNPPGSGKNAIIERINLTNGATAQAIVARISSTSLGGGTGAESKLAGGTVSTSLKQGISQVAAPTGNVVFAMFFGVNTTMTMPLSEPIILPPGKALAINSGAANGLDVPTTFEFYEENQ
ncbi:hypothetical protein [Ralstonia sp. NFACC01]|uniref:hypothetical protein n=1 Tax=Ralstonia sp. NFACC01 TaxID=1566294 RepID=UPI0008E3D864|nr:hypothetical protein [Ralstonia sp. NFACC01]SFQ19293.1 hypothetical protein SAMN03159417_04556 [Ralstonia sp. NFACC01]